MQSRDVWRRDSIILGSNNFLVCQLRRKSHNMRVCLTLLCCFFLSLLDGNSVHAQIILYTGTEGGEVTMKCPNSLLGQRKLFCKDDCKQEDVLIDTTEVKAQRGRYSIEWKKTRGLIGDFSVSITQLAKSDSGLYRCGLVIGRVNQIEVIVVDALLDGNPSEVKTLHARTGGNLVVECYFHSALRNDRMYFCKEPCEDKDLLVETTGSTAQSGRYSIRYVEEFQKGGFLYVSITQLMKSDSGRYGCGLDKRLSQDPYREFEVIVTDAPTAPDLTEPLFPSSAPSASTAISSGSSPSETTEQSGSTTRDVLLFVGLTLVVMVTLSLCALVFYRKRTSKPKEPPEEMQYAYVTETNRVYENVMEDGQSRSGPVDISSIYTSITYAGPDGAETNDDYSLVTAAASPNTAEDNSSTVAYSQVNFSNRAVASSSSALRGGADNVVYSDPRVETSSDASHAEEELPVYSTVNTTVNRVE